MFEKDQPDLFEYQPPQKYPAAAGHRGVDTSVQAAAKVDEKRGRKAAAYCQIIAHLVATGGATGSEMAEALEMGLLYIRPRLTELQLAGEIKDSGQRRANTGGSMERVFVLVAK